MKFLTICLSVLLSFATAFAPDVNPPVDPRTNMQGYPTSQPPMDIASPSLKQFSGNERKLWQARVSGKTDFIRKLMSKDARIVSSTGIKDKEHWIAAIRSGACRLNGYRLSDFVLKVTSRSAGSISYRADQDAVCNGKSLPQTLNVGSTYLYLEGTWRNIFYEETPVAAQSEGVARRSD
jgi:hypothetical protein